MDMLINYLPEQVKTFQTASAWSCATADAVHLIVKGYVLGSSPFDSTTFTMIIKYTVGQKHFSKKLDFCIFET